jgi:hypothetical protein
LNVNLGVERQNDSSSLKPWIDSLLFSISLDILDGRFKVFISVGTDLSEVFMKFADTFHTVMRLYENRAEISVDDSLGVLKHN